MKKLKRGTALLILAAMMITISPVSGLAAGDNANIFLWKLLAISGICVFIMLLIMKLKA